MFNRKLKKRIKELEEKLQEQLKIKYIRNPYTRERDTPRSPTIKTLIDVNSRDICRIDNDIQKMQNEISKLSSLLNELIDYVYSK